MDTVKLLKRIAIAILNVPSAIYPYGKYKDGLWREHKVFFPVKTLTGDWTMGTTSTIYVRWHEERWQYIKEEESFEDWCDRQW